MWSTARVLRWAIRLAAGHALGLVSIHLEIFDQLGLVLGFDLLA
jgi:hypothetical protein